MTFSFRSVSLSSVIFRPPLPRLSATILNCPDIETDVCITLKNILENIVQFSREFHVTYNFLVAYIFFKKVRSIGYCTKYIISIKSTNWNVLFLYILTIIMYLLYHLKSSQYFLQYIIRELLLIFFEKNTSNNYILIKTLLKYFICAVIFF